MINVSIIGVSGYTGVELVKILTNHPKFNISYLANSSGNTTMSSLYEALYKVVIRDVLKMDIDEIARESDLVFLALPHKTSMQVAKQLIEKSVKVIDLSADYRLELDTYEKHYCTHEDKKNLENFIYGLPEYYKSDISKAKYIANPGCYPTATLLGLLPFVEYIDENSNVFVDAKSGVSGAGKKLSDITSFVNVNENIFAYDPLNHRHCPEINEKINKVKNKKLNIQFVPHLINVTRGMLVSIYVTLNKKCDAKEIINEAYRDETFVRIKNSPVNIKDVSGTNFCDIYVQQNGNALFINTSIDNLLRGASSQAVVNANIMFGFNEDCGINKIAYIP